MSQIVVKAIFAKGRKSVVVPVLVDTGAEVCIITSDYAKDLGLKKAFSGRLVGAGGGRDIYYARVSSIKIRDTRCESGPIIVAVVNESVFPLGGLTGLGGILGLDFMKKTRMNIAAAAATGVVRCGAKR